MCNLHVNILVYGAIVLHWHGAESNYFATKTIYSTNVCGAKHDKFFILVYVDFFTKVACHVWNWIPSSFTFHCSPYLLPWVDTLKRGSYTILPNTTTLS